MAKRGETRPWRLQYVWESGIKGVTTFRSQEEADYKAKDLREYAERVNSSITITVSHRDVRSN